MLNIGGPISKQTACLKGATLGSAFLFQHQAAQMPAPPVAVHCFKYRVLNTENSFKSGLKSNSKNV